MASSSTANRYRTFSTARRKKSRRKPLFFRRPPDRPKHRVEGDLPDLAVRDGRWKLLCNYDGSEPELYDLKTDRGESTNVAAEHPMLVKRLPLALLDWHQSLPTDKGANFVSLRDSSAERRKARVKPVAIQ